MDTCPRCGGRLKQPSWGSPDPHALEDCIKSLAERIGDMQPGPKGPPCPECQYPMTKVNSRKWVCEQYHPGDDE